MSYSSSGYSDIYSTTPDVPPIEYSLYLNWADKYLSYFARDSNPYHVKDSCFTDDSCNTDEHYCCVSSTLKQDYSENETKVSKCMKESVLN